MKFKIAFTLSLFAIFLEGCSLQEYSPVENNEDNKNVLETYHVATLIGDYSNVEFFTI